MALAEVVVKQLPNIQIYTRHSRTCAQAGTSSGGGQESFKRCRCWKWLRWHQRNDQTGRSILKRLPTKCRDWAGAERARHDLLKRLEAAAFGMPVKQDNGIAQAAKLYVADKQQQGLRSNTIAKNKRTTDRLVKFCELKGLYNLDQITSEQLMEYRATWDWAKTPEVRKNEQTRIKSFFRWCHANELTTKNPALKLSAIKGDRTPTMPYEPEEMKAIVAACDKCGFTSYMRARVRGLILLMRESGLSIIDAASLRRDELVLAANGEHNVVRRRLKTGILVNNNIPKKVALELLAVPNDNSTYFFWTGVGDERSIAGKFSNELQAVFTAARISDGHAHRFRHTYAVELLKAGADIRAVQKALGHGSLPTTEKYYAQWNKAQQDIHNDTIRSARKKMTAYA
jgi:integrase/recombinase XerD